MLGGTNLMCLENEEGEEEGGWRSSRDGGEQGGAEGGEGGEGY